MWSILIHISALPPLLVLRVGKAGGLTNKRDSYLSSCSPNSRIMQKKTKHFLSCDLFFQIIKCKFSNLIKKSVFVLPIVAAVQLQKWPTFWLKYTCNQCVNGFSRKTRYIAIVVCEQRSDQLTIFFHRQITVRQLVAINGIFPARKPVSDFFLAESPPRDSALFRHYYSFTYTFLRLQLFR